MYRFTLSNGVSGEIWESDSGGDVMALLGIIGLILKAVYVVVTAFLLYGMIAWATGGVTDIFHTGATEVFESSMPFPLVLLIGALVYGFLESLSSIWYLLRFPIGFLWSGIGVSFAWWLASLADASAAGSYEILPVILFSAMFMPVFVYLSQIANWFYGIIAALLFRRK